jgi:transposase
MALVRWGWNLMVRLTRRVARQKSHASRYRAELADWVVDRGVTGRRVEKLRKLMAESGLSQDQAIRAANDAALQKAWSSRRSGLGVAYAKEAVDRKRKGMLDGAMGGAWVRLTSKFEDAWKACWKQQRGAPRKTRDARWICVGILKNSIRIGERNRANENYIDLSAVLLPRFRGNAAISQVKFLQHRPLPRDATVKDLKVIRTSNRRGAEWYIVLAIETDGQIEFPATGLACGVDPGLKTAATLAGEDVLAPGQDGEEIDLGKPYRKSLKKLRRLQRRWDRQNRANNPQCFDANGVWRKNVRATNTSRGMAETQEQIAALQRHLANLRLDYYSNAANRVLSRYDIVYFGSWTDGTPEQKGKARKKREEAFEQDGTKRPKGEAARQTTINQIARDNALGIFRRQLEEKAKRSTTPKQVIPVPESNTTRRCAHCGALAGPTGQRQLGVRAWACTECGFDQLRDRAAAWNILQAGRSQAATQAVTRGSHKSSVARKARKGKGATSASRLGTDHSNVPAPRPAVPGRVTGVRARGKSMANTRQALAAPKRIRDQQVAVSPVDVSGPERDRASDPLARECQDAEKSTISTERCRSG